jgi:hyperosmotically inducible protein
MLQKFAMILSAVGLVVTAACSQTDAGITTAVKSKLAADTTVKAYQINVDTSNAVVTLTGVVEAPAAKEQAVAIARKTDGVKDVVDHISVNAAAATTPEHVGESAEQGIKDATRTAGEKISEGTDKAVDATKDGAREATDKTKNAAEKTGGFITDSAITTAVKTKLVADSKTPGLKIDVDTNNGVVTLSGTVPTKAAENKAVADARGTKGVKRVVNNLKVAS